MIGHAFWMLMFVLASTTWTAPIRFAGSAALLLQRSAEGSVEFLVLTLWDSMDAVREFPGPDPERAVVEPNARAVLSDFDELVRHYDVISGSLGT